MSGVGGSQAGADLDRGAVRARRPVAVDGEGRIVEVGPRRGTAGRRRTNVELPGRALLPGFVNAHSHAFQRGLRGRGETFPATGAAASGLGARRCTRWSTRSTRTPSASSPLRAFREMRARRHHERRRVPLPPPRGRQRPTTPWTRRCSTPPPRPASASSCSRPTTARAVPAARSSRRQRRFRSESRATPSWHSSTGWSALDPAPPEPRRGGPLDPRRLPPDEVAALCAEAEPPRPAVPHARRGAGAGDRGVRRGVRGAAPWSSCSIGSSSRARFTAVHCTHTDRADMARFAAAGANVCLCPATEANLGDGIADLPGMLRPAPPSAWAPTRTPASRCSRRPAGWSWSSAWRASARGMARDAERPRRHRPAATPPPRTAPAPSASKPGEIRPGAWADLVAVDLDHPELAGWDEDTLLEAIFLGSSDRAIVGTFVGGAWRRADERGA